MNKNIKFAIVASEFNKEISQNLINGATGKFIELGLDDNNYKIFTVPGAFEIPGLVKQILSKNQNSYDAIVTLGCIVKGETAHFEYISAEVSRGLADVMQQTGVPLGFGVLTTYTTEQALERSKGDASNKGYEATASAIEMASLLKQLKEEK